jgi:hypothetical protein
LVICPGAAHNYCSSFFEFKYALLAAPAAKNVARRTGRSVGGVAPLPLRCEGACVLRLCCSSATKAYKSVSNKNQEIFHTLHPLP